MPVLFFLPWVSTKDRVTVGDLQLVPYERGARPSDLHGIPLKEIDAVLSNYGNRAYFPTAAASEPITNATLIVWHSAETEGELTEDNIRSRLQEGQLLVFCALAQRRFCSHFEYCNTDGYRMIAQRFAVGDGSSIAVTTRRRDGQTLQYLGEAGLSPRFVRPLHVDDRLSLNIDLPLLEALRAVTDTDFKDRLSAAIDVFVRANTDAPDVPERTEIVLLRVAFETLLNSTHETADLVRCFADHFRDELPSPPVWHSGQFDEAIWRARWPKITRPLDAWVNDLCAVRNVAAHGPRGSKRSPVWAIRDHLLFASWLFPLMVKRLLSSAGSYNLTDEDVALRRGVEAFFAHNVLTRVREDRPDLLYWSQVERSLLLPVFAKRIYSME